MRHPRAALSRALGGDGIAWWCLAVIAVLSVASWTVPEAWGAPRDNKPAELRGIVEGYHEEGVFDGVALVARGDEIVFFGAFGVADREARKNHEPDTRMPIASLTKPFTAALVLRLVADDALDLDAPLATVLPDLRPDATQITVRHLLTHTSGIPDVGRDYYLKQDAADHPRAEFVIRWASGAPAFEPGSQMAYCNVGYYLLGLVAGQADGSSWEDALRKRVLEPLALSSTAPAYAGDGLPPAAPGYEWHDDVARLPARIVNPWNAFAGGGLVSTAGDLHRLARALDGAGETPFLPPELLAAMHDPVHGNYAMGWYVRDHWLGDEKVRIAFHGGSVTTHNTRITRVLGTGEIVVLLANRRHAALKRLTFTLLQALRDLPYEADVVRTARPQAEGQPLERVGIYRHAEHGDREIYLDGKNQLRWRRPGDDRSSLLNPEDRDVFFFDDDHSLTVRFERDDDGRVVRLTVPMQGRDTPFDRVR